MCTPAPPHPLFYLIIPTRKVLEAQPQEKHGRTWAGVLAVPCSASVHLGLTCDGMSTSRVPSRRGDTLDV